jgi:ABC-type branched-subunit amino acid transport system ATPase component
MTPGLYCGRAEPDSLPPNGSCRVVRRLAILLVEQNLRAALAVPDRHHVMNKGELCFTGSSAELEAQGVVLRKLS